MIKLSRNKLKPLIMEDIGNVDLKFLEKGYHKIASKLTFEIELSFKKVLGDLTKEQLTSLIVDTMLDEIEKEYGDNDEK